MDAYEMIEDVRESIGESVAKHWSDRELLRRLNRNYQAVSRHYLEADGDWFLTSVALEPDVNSQIDIPTDAFKVSYLEKTDTHDVISLRDTVRESQIGKLPQMSLTYAPTKGFLIGNKIEINQDNFTEDLTLWYRKRLKDLHGGELGVGTADTSLIFDTSLWPSGEDDYYNGRTVVLRHNTTNAFIGSEVILDYTGATATATIGTLTPNPAAGYFYGTVSELTSEGDLLVIRNTILEALAKPSSVVEEFVFRYWRGLAIEAKRDLDEFLDKRVDATMGVRRT